MRYVVVGCVCLLLGGMAILFIFESPEDTQHLVTPEQSFTETEAGFDPEPANVMEIPPEYRVGGGLQYTLTELQNWERPAGPLRVGLQVGHLNNQDVPEELAGLTRNGAGAVFGQFNERDTVEVIALLVAERLEAEGIAVDVLPAVIPPGYVADAFVSIHADGNTNTSVRGYKIAGPRRDYSGRSEVLVDYLYRSYGEATNLPEDPSISRRMTAYYAFNWPRYEHAVHPFTPSAIVEVGFLTNAADRNFMINQPEISAEGIAEGILAYLRNIPNPLPAPQRIVAPTFPLIGTIECAPVRAERRNRDDRDCLPSLAVGGEHYALNALTDIATGSVPYSATVSGDFVPVQTLDNYFWFHFEVAGIIDEAIITREG